MIVVRVQGTKFLRGFGCQHTSKAGDCGNLPADPRVSWSRGGSHDFRSVDRFEDIEVA